MSAAISLRLPERLAQELEKLAATTERPKSYLVRKAVETYLAEYADYQIALDRLRGKHDATLTGPELRKQLGLQGSL